MKLTEIERLNKKLFGQKWAQFHNATFSEPPLRFPGVYLLAFTNDNLEGKRIEERDVLYVGMSNAQGGVRSRLIQFRKGIEKYGTHSGAMRFSRISRKSSVVENEMAEENILCSHFSRVRQREVKFDGD